MSAVEQAPFILTTPDGAQHSATYGQRVLVGTGHGVRVPASVSLVKLDGDWMSGVALEIVVNETNVAVHVNQRPPGLLIADEPGLTPAEASDPELGDQTRATTAGDTYLTARRTVELTLRQQASASAQVDVGEMWFEQAPFADYRGGTVETPVTPPRAMWLRCMVAATRIFRETGDPATWKQVNEWLAPRCWQQGGFRPGRDKPKDEQQYSAWEAVRAYRLRPHEYSTGSDLWRSVQRALVSHSFPTPSEVEYVESNWDEFWLRYNTPRPVARGGR